MDLSTRREQRPSPAGRRRVRRPLHALTAAGTAAHHAFELAAGVGLVLQPKLGFRRAAALWATTLPGWAGLAALGSRRADRALAAFAGLAAGGAVVHFTLWPWERRRGLPVLTEAEGLSPRALPAYNALLYAWGCTAAAAVARETPRGARRWMLAGMAIAPLMRGSARAHFDWVSEQAARDPAWWNRGVAPRGRRS